MLAVPPANSFRYSIARIATVKDAAPEHQQARQGPAEE